MCGMFAHVGQSKISWSRSFTEDLALMYLIFFFCNPVCTLYFFFATTYFAVPLVSLKLYSATPFIFVWFILQSLLYPYILFAISFIFVNFILQSLLYHYILFAIPIIFVSFTLQSLLYPCILFCNPFYILKLYFAVPFVSLKLYSAIPFIFVSFILHPLLYPYISFAIPFIFVSSIWRYKFHQESEGYAAFVLWPRAMNNVMTSSSSSSPLVP